MQNSRTDRVLVGAGPISPEARTVWLAQPGISHIVRHGQAVSSGRRLGSRVLGIGLDGCLAALKALRRHPRGQFIANNPWIAVPLVLLGRDVWTTGIYAEAGSRSWRVLRRVLGDRPVVATAQVEVEEWNVDGGRSEFVRYGASFGGRLRIERSGPIRVFVGGTSDRDGAVIDRLIHDVAEARDVELVVATGESGPAHVLASGVHYPGWVDQGTFVDLIRDSDVVFLPLRAGTRAAGHMVTVAALECGVPVMTTRSRAMDGYVDGQAVRELDDTEPILPALIRAAQEGRSRGATFFREHWRARHAPEANARSVLAAFARLSEGRARA